MSDTIYNREKEFLKLAFMKGWLDVGSGFDTLKAFVEIMEGEIEAVLAIDFSQSWLSKKEVHTLLKIANPNKETLRELRAWTSSINGPIANAG